MASTDRASHNVLLYDENGNPLFVQDGGTVPATQSAVIVGGIDGSSANALRVHQTDDLQIAERQSWLNYSFDQTDTTLDTTAFWTSAVTGTGATTQTAGVGTLSTGVTANSTVAITSTPIARLLPNTTNEYATFLQTGNTGVTNNIRRWGAFDANNGYFFALNGTTLQFVTRKATVDTPVTISTFTLDTNFHHYQILYNGMGAVALIDGVSVSNLSPIAASAPTANDNLPIRFDNNNSGGLNTNQTLVARYAMLSGFGVAARRSRFISLAAAATTVVKRGPGTLRKVMVNNLALASTVTLTDNTAAGGTAIAIISSATIGSFIYDLDFNVGLTCVIAGTPNITVIFD